MNRLRPKLTYANVVSTICLFLLLGGGAAFAASQLGKNTVGPKQLKRNAVTTAKVKKEAITGAKVKKGTLTGTQINLSTLGTVPSAQTANTVAAAEGWHNAALENGWDNAPPPSNFLETAGFYKDQGGVVHLRGLVINGTDGKAIFHLPAGYRPESGKAVAPLALCGFGCPEKTTPLFIFGPGIAPGQDGAVLSGDGNTIGLDGITFRAES
jgi:hypothetical protein